MKNLILKKIKWTEEKFFDILKDKNVQQLGKLRVRLTQDYYCNSYRKYYR